MLPAAGTIVGVSNPALRTPVSATTRPVGAIRWLQPVVLTRATGRLYSTARSTSKSQCWRTPLASLYQLLLVIRMKPSAPARTCWRLRKLKTLSKQTPSPRQWPRQRSGAALRPALRVLFGVTAAFFAIAAWAMDLTQWLGATGRVAQVSLGLIFFGAAMGAAAMAVSLVRETGPKALASLRTAFGGQGARQLAATVGAAVLLGAVWVFLGWFPEGIIGRGLVAARASTAALSVVLLAAASVQMAILLRGTGSKQALRLGEAAGLVTAAGACAANYVIFVA